MTGQDFSTLLEKALSSEQLTLLRDVAAQATQLKMPLYIVGGFVRDLWLGHPSLDFDLVVEGDAITLAHALVSKYGGKVTVHEKFRTSKWFLPKNLTLDTGTHDTLDLISARSETYKHPAALPTVKMGSIADDIRRRDFTINTLAVRLDNDHFGELLDEVGGFDDLQKSLVRVLHPRSFIDDPTRMFRAVRYEGRYGFKITNEALALIPEALGLIDKLSAQRVRHELDLILEEPNAASMLTRLEELDLLKPIHAALSFDESARERFARADHDPPLQFSIPNFSVGSLRWLLWLMPLSEKQLESLNKRLHFTAALFHFLQETSKLFSSLSSYADLKPSQCVERLDEIPPLSIYAVSLAASDGKSKQALRKYLAEWRYIKPRTTGNDLKKLGLEPGPKYKKILWKLRAAWLDGEISSEAEERVFLEKLL